MPVTFYRQVITAGTLIHTGPGSLVAVFASHAESAAQTIVFYDNTGGSGTTLFTIVLPAASSPYFVHFPPNLQLPFSTGLYASPASAKVIVWAIGR